MVELFLEQAFLKLREGRMAEDALQEAFCRLWSGNRKPKDIGEALRLLSTTRRNIQIDEYRKRKRHREVPIADLQFEAPEELPDERPDEREALFREVEASIDEELTQLQKTIVRKYEYEGLPLKRIAKELGMQEPAVRMQLSRARKTLRNKFRNNETD